MATSSSMRAELINGIVTGAASGIGLATCKMLLEAGALKVGMLNRQQTKLLVAREELATTYSPYRVSQFCLDVRDDPEKVARAIEQFEEWAGCLNLVINRAGVLLNGAVTPVSFRGVERYPLEQWETTLDINLTGAFLVTREAIDAMLRSRVPNSSVDDSSRRLIVTISSVSRLGRAGDAAYGASKGALASLVVTLAQELVPYRVPSVAIASGLVDTPVATRIPEAQRRDMLDRSGNRENGPAGRDRRCRALLYRKRILQRAGDRNRWRSI